MKRIIFLLFSAFLMDASFLYAQHRVTVEDMMEQVKQMYPVSFVYDASIRLDIPYTGKKPGMVSLESTLETLFHHTNIKWEIDGSHVILKKLLTYALSGYVYQDNGETVVNATVWDMTSNVGTLTNEHGFYSLTLSEGRHKIRFSHIGSGEHLEDVTLGGNKSKKHNSEV